MSVNPERELKLGPAENGRALKGRILVRNTGGTNASLQIIAPTDIQIFPDASSIVLAGGSEQAFEVRAERSKSGALSKTIRIQSPACDPVDITIESPAEPENHAAVPVEKFLSLPPPVPETSPEKKPPTGKIPPVETANLLKSKNHEVEISWQLTSPNTSGFKIERRQISGGKEGHVIVRWIPWPEAKITISNGTAVALFQRLPANTYWAIRIIALDEYGNPCLPSSVFQISTKPLVQFHFPWWAWLFPIVVLAAAAFKLWRRHQRGLLTRENERISRLELK